MRTRPTTRTNPTNLARHVIKFADGTYLGRTLSSRVKSQTDAQRFLTWASAKAMTSSLIFEGRGARAVRLIPVAWCALTIDGKLVLLGSSKRVAENYWRPDLNPGGRLVKYIPSFLRRGRPS
jgi:hypothetical protein